MYKKALAFTLFIFCFYIFVFSANAQGINAKGAVLLEAQSGDVIYGCNKDLRLPMASTTKIMTALVVLENTELDHIVTIEPHMTGIEGSSIYLHEGEKLSVSDLLYALMLESANDAAVALAHHVCGGTGAFAQKMNDKANELGLKNTHFTNPHGLDDPEHYTTAYELALIARAAMENPVFREIVSTYKKQIPLNNGEGARVLINHNRLLRTYEGAIGIKTGYTKKCGRCLVSCAERDGVTLICVTLNAPNDWSDHASLFDRGFNEYKSINLARVGDYSVKLNAVNGEKSTFIAENNQDLKVTLKADNINISAVLEAERMYFAPIKKGERVGKIVFYNNEEKIGELALFAKENVKNIIYKKSIFERLFG